LEPCKFRGHGVSMIYIGSVNSRLISANAGRIIEMNVGLICCCVPSFSKMLRTYMPAVREFLSSIHTRFDRLDSTLHQERHNTDLSQSDRKVSSRDSEAGALIKAPYRALREKRSRDTANTSDHSYELGQVKGPQPAIRTAGRGTMAPMDNSIHVARDISLA
jgi:hypothetical protein